MATIRARIKNLEKLGNTRKLKEAVYCVCLPATDDEAYQQVQADIIRRKAAGQRVVVFEVVDASARKKPANQLSN
jgi:hypothetical protein